MVTDYAGLPENIRPGTDGWIVPVHGHAAMAAALRDMLNDREDVLRRGKAARDHAIAEFGIGTFLDHTEAVYARLLAGAPSLDAEPGPSQDLASTGRLIGEDGHPRRHGPMQMPDTPASSQRVADPPSVW